MVIITNFQELVGTAERMLEYMPENKTVDSAFWKAYEICIDHRYTLDRSVNRALSADIVENEFHPSGYVLLDQDSLNIWTFPNLTQAVRFAKKRAHRGSGR